ncbi:Dual specificity protein phosphatase 3 [Orchesella cincta]|uniref:protein-serine/threonine phosphatase n=1 Tax=Orchesella cincta TaxID=48709 RepID=A0A1D2NM13_ORCCI|nr:Dual specificity protein phosphatase 3 [Orchesella cincta]
MLMLMSECLFLCIFFCCSIPHSRLIARDVRALAELGVTHVLNAAVGVDPVRYVDTSELFYLARNFRCKFMGIPAMDIQSFQLAPYFHETSEFIADALKNREGKVLVHCLQGLSRSATLVLAFLIIKKGMYLKEAVEMVRGKRKIFPNNGFLLQLVDLEVRIQRLNNMNFEPYNLR